ncbi:MAG: hypothetical protein K9G70_13185 [Prolixibacteraceae bacterium]|nr:hypothetical protein [Prolixibacteraceae bacterium]
MKNLELESMGVQEMNAMEMKNENGGGKIAYWTGRILGELLDAYGDANPGPRTCPI